MRLICILLICFNMVSSISFAQERLISMLNIGDSAPPLRISKWIKGNPVKKFEKGKVYIIEFWATWCRPCIAAMPHLSELARKYKERLIILGIDIYEKKTSSNTKVKAFVDSMGYNMDYTVASEDSNFMAVDWINGTGEKDNGIPRSFIINTEGQLAWIGHPTDLDEVLPNILDNTWDLKQALSKRNEDKRLKDLSDSLIYELTYGQNGNERSERWKNDSALLFIDKATTKEPLIKYAPRIADYTFSILLKTNQQKAYEYGKAAIKTATYDEPAYDEIGGLVEFYSDKLNLMPEIYRLGIEAYQNVIDNFPYPEIFNIPKKYNKMAEWYWNLSEKLKAIETQEKAIKAVKNYQYYSEKELSEYKSRLETYIKMNKK